jgi:acyl-CoA dehydrogenase
VGPPWIWALAALATIVLFAGPLRRALVVRPTMRLLRRRGVFPRVSVTEREALEAGDVWLEGQIFSGRPDLDRLASSPYPPPTEEERAFLAGPVEEVCRITRDWDVHVRRDLSPETWAFLKRERFLGMIVPREYGGLGFSATGHGAVIAKLASRSQTLAISVMVPNALGPAELLVHYGTDEQKRRWLPRLARGDEMPCFALTEPGAGSDAASISARGVVFRGEDGAPRIRLDWNKRYITLAPIATVLGLAFRLEDPENLLGRGTSPGITCALVPASTPGVVIERRHDPLGVPFHNAPTRGEGVVVPVDAIIGGADGAGRGWRMLMETLAAGRGVSLPSMSAGILRLVARVVGAHAGVRRQFGLPLARFEGVEEALARIGGALYALDALRLYAAGGLDGGARPAVATAIAKYAATETCRAAVSDAMDVLGGAGIVLGPRNLIGRLSHGTPIAITVEGANILTRTLVVFGQGAIRCHPAAWREIRAMEEDDDVAFERALARHALHASRALVRAGVLSATRAAFVRSPVRGPAARWWRRLAWTSARFAALCEVAMLGLGANLKRRERVSGRFADVLTWSFVAAATLRRFEFEGARTEDVPLMEQAVSDAFVRIQAAFDALYRTVDAPGLAWWLRGPGALWSRMNPIASAAPDRVGADVARILTTPGSQRERLTAGMYVPTDADEQIARLDAALAACAVVEPLERRLRDAVKSGALRPATPSAMLVAAVETGVLSAREADQVRRAEALRDDAIQVDSFPIEHDRPVEGSSGRE